MRLVRVPARRMSATRRWSATIAAALFCAAPIAAQEDEQPAAAEDEAIEEIVVISRKSGDPAELEAKYQAAYRERIRREMERMRVLEEEYEWRKADASELDDPSRIKWGYDPRDELRMRTESGLHELPFEGTTRPATLFRVTF